MPHGNKKSRSTNKKKKNNKNDPSHSAKSKSTPARADAAKEKKDLFSILRDLPKEINHATAAGNSSSSGLGGESLYVRYKLATKRFQDALLAKLPSDFFLESPVTVNNVMDAAEYVSESDIAIEQEMMRDLKIAISGRQIVSNTYVAANEDDKGHQYFLAALAFCWGRLRFKQTQRSQPTKTKDTTVAESTPPIANRFASLSVNDEEEDVLEDDDDDASIPVQKERPDVPKTLLADMFAENNDRDDACYFLYQVNMLMKDSADRFAIQKLNYKKFKDDGLPSYLLIFELMKPVTASNMAIRLVAQLEHELMVIHPHLCNVYRIIAIAILPQVVAVVVASVQKLSPTKADQFTMKDAVEYVGDALALSFSDATNNDFHALASKFSKKWRMDFETVDSYYTLIYRVKNFECLNRYGVKNRTKEEKDRDRHMANMLGFTTKNSWFRNLSHLGGDRSITTTINRCQLTANYIAKNTPVYVVDKSAWPMYGPLWDEEKNVLANNIYEDMESYLVICILPMLLHVCYEGSLSYDEESLPFKRELLTIFTEVEQLAKHPEKPLSWSLVFAVHLLLTSVFEMQGEGCVASIADDAEKNSRDSSTSWTTWRRIYRYYEGKEPWILP